MPDRRECNWSLSHRRPVVPQSVMGSITFFSRVELFKRAHFPNRGDPAFKSGHAFPCELFDTDSESDPAQSQQMPGAFQAPPLRERLCGKTCVQDLSEA